LQQLLPPHVRPIAVADSGFRTPFFREVERLGRHWLGRIRHRDFIVFADRAGTWLAAKSLYAKVTRKSTLLGLAHWVRSNPLAGQLVTFFRLPKGRKQAKREKEPWLLVVSPSLKAYSAVRVVDYYRTRMQIEEGFRDTQSTHYGLDFTSESRIQTERRANLLLIAALVIFALWNVGICLKGSATERQIRVHSGQNCSPYGIVN
jgi:hypothetical protein